MAVFDKHIGLPSSQFPIVSLSSITDDLIISCLRVRTGVTGAMHLPPGARALELHGMPILPEALNVPAVQLQLS